MASLNKKIRRQIANMPKYTIQDEAFQNQAIARTRAYGRDRDVQMAQEEIEQSAADATSDAMEVTPSTTDLLGTIAAIQSNTAGNTRGLAREEATIRGQRVNELYGANQALIDEKDKAWMQNVYAPWDAKLRNLQQRKARRSAFWSNVAGGLLTAAGAAIRGTVGGAIGVKVGGAISGGGQAATGADLINGSVYGYNPYAPLG